MASRVAGRETEVVGLLRASYERRRRDEERQATDTPTRRPRDDHADGISTPSSYEESREQLSKQVRQLEKETETLHAVLASMDRQLVLRDERIAALENDRLEALAREEVMCERLREAIEQRGEAEARITGMMKEGGREDEDSTALRQRLSEIQTILDDSQFRQEQQDALLVEMQKEVQAVLAQNNSLQEQLHRLENKYSKAKVDVKTLSDALQRVTDAAPADGRLSGTRDILQAARERHAEEEERTRREEEEREWRIRESLSPLADGWATLVNDERAIARSLHDDLDATRKLLLDRDSAVLELGAALSEIRVRLSLKETEVAMLEGRAEEVESLASGETSVLLSMIRQTTAENERLSAALSDVQRERAILTTKLEAQGRDLTAVKKELQRIRLG